MNEHSHVVTDPVERSPHSRRNALLTALVLVVVGLLAWALTRGGGEGGAGAGARRRPPTTVGVAKVVAADIPQSLQAIGTVQPIVVATVRPQLSGNIFTINFTEGQVVRKGQLLAQIDPRPYRLQLAQAEANLARDEAALTLARTNLQRYQTLLRQDSIAKAEVDTQLATVRQAEGTVAADRAAVGTARLNLQYTSITAPVAGRVGLRQADIGNYVTPGDTSGIAVITQTTPIDVSFAVPQGNLPGILAKHQGAGGLAVTVTDQSGSDVIARGRFLTFDNQIDAATGTVQAKARFENGSGRLFPSQFVNVSLLVDTLRGIPAVPVSAVRHGTQGDFLFVLQSDKTVKMQTVKIGAATGTQVAVLEGVRPGQTVITEGADSLEEGAKVTLPGDRPEMRQPRERGFFAGLFGGAEEPAPARSGQPREPGQAPAPGAPRQQQAGGTTR
jgi:multidrug efflux system membrane fusion protein